MKISAGAWAFKEDVMLTEYCSPRNKPLGPRTRHDTEHGSLGKKLNFSAMYFDIRLIKLKGLPWSHEEAVNALQTCSIGVCIWH
jgi:hypothetical protein